MPNFYYFQERGGEEKWKPVPASMLAQLIAETQPMFVTALGVSKLVEEMSHEDQLKLKYDGPLYFDWDSEDSELVTEKVNQFLDKLVDMKVNLEACRLYATGGRGYHLEIPTRMFIDKPDKAGVVQLASVYREMALQLAVDTLDLRVYSGMRGRMWRQSNVDRGGGRYKVPITITEMREMTPEMYFTLTCSPRPAIEVEKAELCMDLTVLYQTAFQRVEDNLKKRGKIKPDPSAREKALGPTVELMMEGVGIKPGTGFQVLSLQLAIVAQTARWSEHELVEKCAGLIARHESDGRRYATAEQRSEELRRMWRYMQGNPCYEFSVGALKNVLDHAAPDLDSIPATKEEIKQVIAEDANDPVEEMDEYGDVARGITLNRYGVWMDTADGKKRICAVSFRDSALLVSMDLSQIVGYQTRVLVNGRDVGIQTLELEVFSGLVQFNRFVAKYGHSFQGTDVQVRTVMMRFVEQAKKKGTSYYIVKREGMDLVHIPNHENTLFHTPFLVWADSHGVHVQPDIKATGLDLMFAGYPDPRGVFKTDIGAAPGLGDWLVEGNNKASMIECLTNLMTCQRPELLGKFLGWYTACFWKPMFQKAYGKFPLLHVNGAAGAGKSDMTRSMANMFTYQVDPKITSPGSTTFAISSFVAGSASLPVIIDEYKPHVMDSHVLEKLRALFRDAYNQTETNRGGGTREQDDYRVLNSTQLSAPIVFIAEATESEAAIMERVVLATVVTPEPHLKLLWYKRFQTFRKNKQYLGILGQYLALDIVQEYSVERLRTEFDALYEEAQNRYMLSEADLQKDLNSDEMREKTNAKERTVYNHCVAKFGFQRLRALIEEVLPNAELSSAMRELEDGIYTRMVDLQATTTPEIIRTLDMISSMSYSEDKDKGDAIRHGKEYALVDGMLELDARTSYGKYRMHMAAMRSQPLFGSELSFVAALQEVPAYVKRGTGQVLQRPGIFTLRIDDLMRAGVPVFSSK